MNSCILIKMEKEWKNKNKKNYVSNKRKRAYSSLSCMMENTPLPKRRKIKSKTVAKKQKISSQNIEDDIDNDKYNLNYKELLSLYLKEKEKNKISGLELIESNNKVKEAWNWKSKFHRLYSRVHQVVVDDKQGPGPPPPSWCLRQVCAGGGCN